MLLLLLLPLTSLAEATSQRLQPTSCGRILRFSSFLVPYFCVTLHGRHRLSGHTVPRIRHISQYWTREPLFCTLVPLNVSHLRRSCLSPLDCCPHPPMSHTVAAGAGHGTASSRVGRALLCNLLSAGHSKPSHHNTRCCCCCCLVLDNDDDSAPL
jgi:hypothetical protein